MTAYKGERVVVTLRIPATLAARITRQAAAQGLSANDWLWALAAKELKGKSPPGVG
jgi:predicted HicB family RNase H-like nuclease